MDYDFDTIVSRIGTDSTKWDKGEDILPMWVADMDFKTSPEIISDLKNRIDQGIFGYTDISDEWKKSIISWWGRRYNFKIHEDWILYSTGVIPSLSSLIRKFSSPGDNILVMTPVYDIFFHSIENNGRHVLECPLDYHYGSYSLDFNKLDKLMKTPNTPILLLCNPHNPTGNVWTKTSLQMIGRLCYENNMICISDEIHCDILRENVKYAPYADACNLTRNASISLISPTKSFNLAGIQTSAIICPNPALREKVIRTINNDEIAEPNIFSQVATIAAYNKSEDWLKALLAYLDKNISIAHHFFIENLPYLTVVEGKGTYLLWIDCSSITQDATKLRDFLLEDVKLYLTAGEPYRGNGKIFLRMNIACPKAMLMKGLKKLKKGIGDFVGNKPINLL